MCVCGTMQVISNWGVKVPVSVTIMDTMNQHLSKLTSAESQYNYVLIYSMTVVLDHIVFMSNVQFVCHVYSVETTCLSETPHNHIFPPVVANSKIGPVCLPNPGLNVSDHQQGWITHLNGTGNGGETVYTFTD